MNGDGYRQDRIDDRGQHVARDSRAAHAQHHDVVDLVGGREQGHVERPGGLVRRRQLLRQPGDGLDEAE